jgi:hypothetical protein
MVSSWALFASYFDPQTLQISSNVKYLSQALDPLIVLVHLITLLKLSFRSNTTFSSSRIDCGSSYKFAVLKPSECYKTNDISYYHHGSKKAVPPISAEQGKF